jgi:hypothetical protein
VLAVWGWGFIDQEHNVSLALDIAESMQATPGWLTTLMDGVPFY